MDRAHEEQHVGHEAHQDQHDESGERPADDVGEHGLPPHDRPWGQLVYLIRLRRNRPAFPPGHAYGWGAGWPPTLVAWWLPQDNVWDSHPAHVECCWNCVTSR